MMWLSSSVAKVTAVRDKFALASVHGLVVTLSVITLLGTLASLQAPFYITILVFLLGAGVTLRAHYSPLIMRQTTPPEFPDEYVAPFIEGEPEVDLWQPLPVGVTLSGMPLYAPLWDLCGLVAGMPGRGKSAFMRTLAGAVALYPHAKLAIADGMAGPDYSALAKCTVYIDLVADPEPFEDYLDTLLDEIPKRARRLAELDIDKLDKETCEREMPLWITFIDEYLTYSKTLIPDDKLGKRIEAKLSKIVSQGRKVGVLVIAATQHPTRDTMHSAVKKSMLLRVCMKVQDQSATNVVLGTGSKVDASTISELTPGVGYFQTGSAPIKFRSYVTERADLDRLADIAYQRKLATGCLAPADVPTDSAPRGAATVRLDTEPDIVDEIMATMDAVGSPEKIWTEDLIHALADRTPEYRSLTPQKLARMIKDAGYTGNNQLKTTRVKSNGRTGQGHYRKDLVAARERKRNRGHITRAELERERWDELPDTTQKFVRGMISDIRAGDRPCYYHDGAHPGTTVDHVVPIIAGGTWEPTNIVPACAYANSRKADQDVDAFLAAERERWSVTSSSP